MDSTQPRPQASLREPKQACGAEECNRPVRARGLCNAHYLRWWKTASPEERRRPSKVQLFWAKVQKGPGCWEWQGARRPTGHGIFLGPEQKAISAARFSLELYLKQGIPAGMETCHRCDNPPCVRQAYAMGAETKSLAGQFGIAVPTLRQIVLGLKWKHAGGPITRRRPKRARKVA